MLQGLARAAALRTAGPPASERAKQPFIYELRPQIMAETENGDEGFINGGDGGEQPLPQVSILAQYVKDLSFENPNAPASLQQGAGQPKIDINVNVAVKKQADDVYEVELKLAATATFDNGRTAFIAELLYGGVFGLRHVPEEHLELFLVVEAPRQLFPFARRILADATRDGGFPPLMLDPIDFAQLYFARQAQIQRAEQSGETGNA
jgi:preprotein translocase subunit SecB